MKVKYSSAYPNQKWPDEIKPRNIGFPLLDKSAELLNEIICRREVDITEKTIEIVKSLFRDKKIVSSKEIRNALEEAGEDIVGVETDLLRVGIIKSLCEPPPFLYRLRRD